MKYTTSLAPLSKLKANPNNPRVLKDQKFKQLVKSLEALPSMLDVRPIIVDENWMVLGGNMRLRALQELKVAKVPVTQVTDWTEDQKREFIIKDNLAFGEWDWDMIANEWDAQELNDWGMDVINFDSDVNLDEFFEDDNEARESNFKIVLEYSEDDYNKVITAFQNHSGSKEDVVAKLLGV